MNVSKKVLHLSLLLAMTLPAAVVLADDSENATTEEGSQTQYETQVAAGKGSPQQFKNAGEADKLRHRVNEADKEQAERKRLEKQDQDGEQLKEQDRLREQDQLKQQDMLKQGDQTGSQQQSGEESQQMSQTRNQFQHRYQYETRSAGQGFSTDGSMFQHMNSHSAMSGVGSATRGSGGGGGGAGRR